MEKTYDCMLIFNMQVFVASPTEDRMQRFFMETLVMGFAPFWSLSSADCAEKRC